MPLEQIKSILNLTDKFTIKAIVDYLKIDSIEFVKSIWNVLHENNVLQATSYIDWALQRNENLIKAFSKYWKEKTKVPYIEDKQKPKKL